MIGVALVNSDDWVVVLTSPDRGTWYGHAGTFSGSVEPGLRLRNATADDIRKHAPKFAKRLLPKVCP